VETLLTRSRERLDVGGLIEDRLHELERFYRSIAMLGELTARGCDAVALFGEHLSSSILAAVLREREVRAQAISATDLIVTDDSFGADVLHPRTIRPVIEGRIPLRIVNSLNPGHRGTRIVESPGVSREILPAITSSTSLSLIAIDSEDDSWALQYEAFHLGWSVL
jgi:aspartokinase